MSINVVFSNPLGVYYPGTEVNGTIVLNLESVIKARSVCIHVDGRAHTHWTETESHSHRNADGTTRTETNTVTYQASVIYVTGEAVVWSDSPGNDKLLPGQYQFPFKFFLPATCAPSFEGCYGYIRYSVSVEIDRKWRFNKSNRKFFTVAPSFDLNTIPQAILPVKDTQCQKTGMILFRHGKILVEASIPKMGFVPGEGILVNFSIDNGTSRPVVKADVKLKQLCRYVAARSGWSCHYSIGMIAHNCTHRREEVKEVACGGKLIEILPKSKGSVQIGVVVPSTVASFNTCPIITVEYYLSVKLHLQGNVNNTVKNNLPILIGTIPVYQMAIVQPAQPSQPAAPYPTIGQPSTAPYPDVQPSTSFSPSAPSAPTNTPPPYPPGPVGPQLPPPTYEESVYGTAGTTKDTDSAEAFAPRYPVYHNLPPVNNVSAPPLPEKS